MKNTITLSDTTLFIRCVEDGMYQEIFCRDGRLLDAGVLFADLRSVYDYSVSKGYADVCIVDGIAHLKEV